jgi:hypothetical protein
MTIAALGCPLIVGYLSELSDFLKDYLCCAQQLWRSQVKCPACLISRQQTMVLRNGCKLAVITQRAQPAIERLILRGRLHYGENTIHLAIFGLPQSKAPGYGSATARVSMWH